MRTWNLMIAAALMAASPTLSMALTDAQKCESTFELASAKFAQCRLTAESKFTKTSNSGTLATALGKCSTKLTDALVKAVTKYGGNCTSETPVAFDAYLAQCSDDVEAASAVGGTALPFYSGGLTACVGDVGACQSDLVSCQGALAACQAQPIGRLLRTGQTTCWNTAGAVISCGGTGQDGELQKGLGYTLVIDAPGTITDGRTGLMWEMLSDDGSIHDKDNTYTWANAFAVKIAALNAGGGFAGHTDWRLPNLTELESIRYLGTANPAVSIGFNYGCAPACAPTTCSCTSSTWHWSSTTYASNPALAWFVDFNDGLPSAFGKTVVNSVRAVRGGS